MQRRPTRAQPHKPSHPTATTARIRETRRTKSNKNKHIKVRLRLTSQPAESARYPAQRHPEHSTGSAGITHGRPSEERRTADQPTSEPRL